MTAIPEYPSLKVIASRLQRAGQTVTPETLAAAREAAGPYTDEEIAARRKLLAEMAEKATPFDPRPALDDAPPGRAISGRAETPPKSDQNGSGTPEADGTEPYKYGSDPTCGECGWEQSHTRHHDPKLYNFHAFVAPGRGSEARS